MITRIEGVAKSWNADAQSVEVEVGGLWYEVLLPTYCWRAMEARPERVSFHIYYHVPDRNPTPVLIGFLRPVERAFFKKFMGVRGMGPAKAQKALASSISTIAHWIETEDKAALRQLPGVGARQADYVVAELKGKVVEEALLRDEQYREVAKPPAPRRGARPARRRRGAGQPGLPPPGGAILGRRRRRPRTRTRRRSGAARRLPETGRLVTTAPDRFELVADYHPSGDQPQAIEQLLAGLRGGQRAQTLLGVTGSGKTFTMASLVAQVQRPTLVLAHNKTLAAQLCTEFKQFFPNNAVEFFVSYYDYYQPEAYVPRSDTYIAKESDINDEIDKLRHSATRALFERRDVLIVASVSCIYGLGEPEEYQSMVLTMVKGQRLPRNQILRRLVDLQYDRDEMNLIRGRFRIRGDTLTIQPAYDEFAVRIEFWDDRVERIVELDPLTGELLAERDRVDIYPAKHFVTSEERMGVAVGDIETELAARLLELRAEGRILEAARLEERTRYDLETLREVGYCPGIENYSRHLARRAPGSTPWTLLDYFPDDWLLFVDESHMSMPQVRGMYGGDTSRKQTLVDYGFRLPSALDNRPLNLHEFERHINQVVFVSATPGPYERQHSGRIVEQIIRPTGLLDPPVEVRPTDGQIDDLVEEVKARAARGERTLVTTLTKKMAEDLADYLREVGVKTHYLHSEQDTFERVEVLRDLRLGVFDAVVGINLLREGLDLPEVSLVAILDADKEGYLRSESSLIQTMGRAARHVDGRAILYADVVTDSMRRAMAETTRRRAIQQQYNVAHGIEPASIRKAIRDLTDQIRQVAEEPATYDAGPGRGALPARRGGGREQLMRLVKDLEKQMKQAARELEFERAAMLRDEIVAIRHELAGDHVEDLPQWSDHSYGRRGAHADHPPGAQRRAGLGLMPRPAI